MSKPPLQIVLGDLTERKVDAIVNAANTTLLGGGGVDGAIHRAAGPELLRACREITEVRPGVRCPPGEARITPGFRLRSQYVIHTVGPVYRDGMSGEPKTLFDCYSNCLQLAFDRELTSIAFPAISCGVYGYPPKKACLVAAKAISEFCAAHATAFRCIELVAFDDSLHKEMLHAVEQVIGPLTS